MQPSSGRRTRGISSCSLFVVSPSVPQTLSNRYSFAFSRLSFKRYKRICSLMDMISIIQQNATEIHLYCLCINFYCWVEFHCMDLLQSVYLFAKWRPSALSLVWGNYEQSCYKHSDFCTGFCVNIYFHFSWVGVRFLGHMVIVHLSL